MNRLNKNQQTKIIAAPVEGNSLRATVRMCDVSFNTALKLVPEIGRACMEYQDKALRNLTCKRIECDEIWSFCYAKDKNALVTCGRGLRLILPGEGTIPPPLLSRNTVLRRR